MSETPRAIIRFHREYIAAAAKADALRAARNAAIRSRIAAGASQADIARALNLTTGRVNQIVNRD